jgi:hypothetical protein
VALLGHTTSTTFLHLITKPKHNNQISSAAIWSGSASASFLLLPCPLRAFPSWFDGELASNYRSSPIRAAQEALSKEDHVTVWSSALLPQPPFSLFQLGVRQYPNLGRIKYALPGWPGQCGVSKLYSFGKSRPLCLEAKQPGSITLLAVSLPSACRGHQLCIASPFRLFFAIHQDSWTSPLLAGWLY